MENSVHRQCHIEDKDTETHRPPLLSDSRTKESIRGNQIKGENSNRKRWHNEEH